MDVSGALRDTFLLRNLGLFRDLRDAPLLQFPPGSPVFRRAARTIPWVLEAQLQAFFPDLPAVLHRLEPEVPPDGPPLDAVADIGFEDVKTGVMGATTGVYHLSLAPAAGAGRLVLKKTDMRIERAVAEWLDRRLRPGLRRGAMDRAGLLGDAARGGTVAAGAVRQPPHRAAPPPLVARGSRPRRPRPGGGSRPGGALPALQPPLRQRPGHPARGAGRVRVCPDRLRAGAPAHPRSHTSRRSCRCGTSGDSSRTAATRVMRIPISTGKSPPATPQSPGSPAARSTGSPPASSPPSAPPSRRWPPSRRPGPPPRAHPGPGGSAAPVPAAGRGVRPSVQPLLPGFLAGARLAGIPAAAGPRLRVGRRRLPRPAHSPPLGVNSHREGAKSTKQPI